jgi:transketolase
MNDGIQAVSRLIYSYNKGENSIDKKMTTVYAETLVELGQENQNIVVLEADLMASHETKEFQKRFPGRAFNVGVAEANMVGIAAGLSATGKIPFAATFGSFAARRTYDQFFISANYARLNVKLVGSDPGITAAHNGGTHMPFEDIGLMRTIPGLIVVEPSDPISLKSLLCKCAYHKGCTYLRLHRGSTQQIYDVGSEFELGKGVVLADGTDVTLIATGVVLVREVMKAAEMLKKNNISAAVIDMHTIKPIDEKLILHYAEKTNLIITCENHQIHNGLGSAVAEVLSENRPTLMKRIGINDEFGEVGTVEYLKDRFGLTAEIICQKTQQLLAFEGNAI